MYNYLFIYGPPNKFHNTYLLGNVHKGCPIFLSFFEIPTYLGPISSYLQLHTQNSIIFFLINQGLAKSDVPFAESYLPTLSHFVPFYLRYLPTQTSDVLYERSLMLFINSQVSISVQSAKVISEIFVLLDASLLW